MSSYTIINHGMLSVFVKTWHFETSSFHLLHGEMSIKLDDVSCLIYLPIKIRLLYHFMITKLDALDMAVNYLEADLYDALKKLEDTRGCHTKLGF